MKRLALGLGLALSATGVLAQDTDRDAGLAAWADIYAVASHPRCTNCHVGAAGRPGWAGLGYGPDRLHAMNIIAGESRIGAESVPCRTCHIGAAGANDRPHAAPQIDDAWRLPPVELAWRGKSSAEVCRQLRNPDTNDGFDMAALSDHLAQSAFVNWGFTPGGGRDAAPGTLAQLLENLDIWVAAGTPCDNAG
ncbi:hypothetical protein [Sulfitobacter sp. S190]|uniref:hypothetical protein n=1 Tax=Sulfitobacter sp. S190 TaxID=2867022 RepID=UPI0021A5E2C5|nr:hypothetical protein [Sulfitobacter sp. S190]UWR21581.1 hypothetical protein K3756_12885 [Sulfitobacter sp. S190]